MANSDAAPSQEISDAGSGRLDSVEKDAFGQWFEALDARFRGGATKWALFNGVLGPDAENLAVEAMTDLAKLFVVKGARLDESTDWDGVRAQLVTTVRNKAANLKRGKARKPGNVGGGKPVDGDADLFAEIADSLGGETWSPTNLEEALHTNLGEVTASVRRDVGEQAWGAFADVKFRDMSANETAAKRGYAGAEEVYRVCEKVTKAFRKRLAANSTKSTDAMST